MKIEIKTGEELNLLLEALKTEIINANSYHRLFCELLKARPAHEREFQQSNTFWHLTLEALQEARRISLCRVAAAQASGDNKAAQIFQATGKMIALKSSGIWQALGDGVGGYEDALGNPFAPFAFDSGFDVDEVPRSKCEKLGLLARGEKAESAIISSKDEVADRLAMKLRHYLAKLTS